MNIIKLPKSVAMKKNNSFDPILDFIYTCKDINTVDPIPMKFLKLLLELGIFKSYIFLCNVQLRKPEFLG